MPLATVIRSGTTPSCSTANHRPVRPNPVMTSSAINSTSSSSQIARTRRSQPTGGMMNPPEERNPPNGGAVVPAVERDHLVLVGLALRQPVVPRDLHRPLVRLGAAD